MEEGLSLRLSIYYLWNRTDDARAQNDSLYFCQPDPGWLVRDDSEASFVAEVAVDHCENTFADEPFQHVKDCWRYRGHVSRPGSKDSWLRQFSFKRPPLNSERALQI